MDWRIHRSIGDFETNGAPYYVCMYTCASFPSRFCGGEENGHHCWRMRIVPIKTWEFVHVCTLSAYTLVISRNISVHDYECLSVLLQLRERWRDLEWSCVLKRRWICLSWLIMAAVSFWRLVPCSTGELTHVSPRGPTRAVLAYEISKSCCDFWFPLDFSADAFAKARPFISNEHAQLVKHAQLLMMRMRSL